MPKIKAIALICSLSILLSIGLAGAEDVPATSKIGYVYAQRILEETIAGKRIKRKLDNLAKEKRIKLESFKDEILKLDEELAKKQLVLSPEAKLEMEDEIRQKQLKMKRYQEDSLMALKRFEKESLKLINNKAMQIIKKIGEEEKYTVILEARESNILFADPKTDITDQVIKAYDLEEIGGTEPNPDSLRNQ